MGYHQEISQGDLSNILGEIPFENKILNTKEEYSYTVRFDEQDEKKLEIVTKSLSSLDELFSVKMFKVKF